MATILDRQKLPVYTAIMKNKDFQASQDIYQRVSTQCLCANLRQAARAITQLYDEFLKPSGLLGTQFRLLGAIAAHGPVALTPLADQLAVDPTTLARNLKPLERDGLVEISKGEDRRTRVLRITERGLDAMFMAVPLWEEAQAWVISQIGEERGRIMLGDWSEIGSLVRK